MDTQSPISKFIIWNIRGTNSATFRRNCQALVKEYNPTSLGLLKIKMTDQTASESLGYDVHLQSAEKGLSRGNSSDVKE